MVQSRLLRCREPRELSPGFTVAPHGWRMNFGMTELLIILVIAVVIFGANRLPELGRGLGKGIRNFKDATREATEEPRKPTT